MRFLQTTTLNQFSVQTPQQLANVQITIMSLS